MKIRISVLVILIGALILPLSACAGKAENKDENPSDLTQKNRLLVLTDIEADPDDTQSLIRLFLYANELDIEGIVATTSVHQKNRVAPESVREVIDEYANVRDRLLEHADGYPNADSLRGIVKTGPALYGMNGVGSEHDSEGSEWIIELLERDDDRPLWVSVWGGPNVLAQALHKIRETRSEDEERRLVSKLRVYTISDQDDSAIWMRREFPDLFYIVSPGGYGNGTWTGISQVIPDYSAEIRNSWFADNIQQGHGPLGKIYPDTAYGYEGDTPAFLNLIPNGLSSPEHPDWGGWGGRYEYYRPEFEDIDPEGFTGGVPVEDEPRAIWTNATDSYTPRVPNEFGRVIKSADETFEDNRVTIWRWRKDVQNDFAARMDWTVSGFDDANHPPIVELSHSNHLTVKSGEGFLLKAGDSTDPDGDSLSFHWFNYLEAGTLSEPFDIEADGVIREVYVTAPEVTEQQVGHIILRVSDRGTPALSRYARIIVTVEPE